MSRLKKAYSVSMEYGGSVKMKSGGKWIQKAVSKNPGSFTKQAQSAGMSVSGFRNKVLATKSDYSSTTVKRANLAKTLSKMRKGADGMDFKDPMAPDRLVNEVSRPTEGLQERQDELLDPGNKVAKQILVGLNSDLAKQAEKEGVAKYQTMLNKKYGLNLAVDGAWGKNTQAAYEKYIKGARSKSTERPISKAQEAVNVSAKTPNRLMPNTSAPYKRPNLTEYLSRPAAQMPTSNAPYNGPTVRQTGVMSTTRPTTSPFIKTLMGYGMGGSIPGVNGSVIGPSVPTAKTGQSFPRKNAGTSKLAKFKKK